MKTPALLTLALLLSACGPTVMTKPGGSEQLARQDHYECFRDAQYNHYGLVGTPGVATTGGSVRATDKRLYRMCMEARGYLAQ